MSLRARTPLQATEAADFAAPSGNPIDTSPLSQSLNQNQTTYGKFNEDFDASQRGSSILEGDGLRRSHSTASQKNLDQSGSVSRSGTLKKKGSLSRKSSLKRSSSRRSMRAGSIKGVSASDDAASPENHFSVFYTPVPTSGTPTEILANRFQAWRKMLKDLIAYFREVQGSYEQRGKALLKVSNVISNTNAPSLFLAEGGINEANRILRDYHKQAVVEANKARDIEVEVIGQLSGLRADLGSKIKEIKSLSGDFKNSVEKEKEGTRKAVAALEDALAAIDVDASAVSGKGDPYVVRLGVERQVERQIDEENYLHRAYLNLEHSGRELESIVVGEVQKAYNALASILKRDADEAYNAVERLREGPIAMPKDHEWNGFVLNDPHFINPNIPLRSLEEIEFPGKHHPAAAEVRAGMLERKSKYLKSYTPGWYVLSPTHLHEFKSADRIYSQPPVMSLYLPEQKLGTHSQPGSSSHKFVLKGRQTGSMHRGHTWVFRAESYETMMAWYEDIKNLTEKTGEERNQFVRRHTRSVSAGSTRSNRSYSDSGLEEDEADKIPYSANNSMVSQTLKEPPVQRERPSPGGRFPSDVNVNGHLHAPLSPSSVGSSDMGDNHDITTLAGGLQDHGYPHAQQGQHYQEYLQPEQAAYGQPERVYDHIDQNPQTYTLPAPQPAPGIASSDYQHQSQPQLHHPQPQNAAQPLPATYTQVRGASSHNSALASEEPTQGQSNISRSEANNEWAIPAAAVGGVAAGALGAEAHRQHVNQEQHIQEPSIEKAATPLPVEPKAMDPVQQAPIPVPVESSYMTAVAHPSNNVTTPLAELPLATPGSVISNQSEYTGVSSIDSQPFGAQQPGQPLQNRAAPAMGILRNNTDISVSDLHVPGQYPKRAV